MKKRMLALILCLVFCFSLMGVAMAAEEVEDAEAEEEVVVVEAEAPEEDGAAEDDVVVEGGIVTYADVSAEWAISSPDDTQDFDISGIGTVSDVQVDGTSYEQTGTNVMGSEVTYWEVNGTTITLAADLAFPNGGTITVIGSEGTLTITATVDSSSSGGGGDTTDPGAGGGSTGGGASATQETAGTWDGESDYVINFYGSASVTDFVATVDGVDVTDTVTYESNGNSTGPTEGINVTFPASYLATLSEGEHTIEMSYTMGAGPSEGTTASVTYILTIGEGGTTAAEKVSVSLSPSVWLGGEEGVTVTVTGIEISSVLVDKEDCGAEISDDLLSAVIPADYLASLADGTYEVVILGGDTPTNAVTLTILTPSPEVVLDAENGVYEHMEGEGLTVTVTGLVSDVVLTVEGFEVGTVLEESEDEYVIVISADELDEIVAGLTSATITVTGIDAKGNERSVSADLKISGEWDNEITGDLDPAEAEWEFGQDEDGLTFALDLDDYTVYITDSNGITNIVEVEVDEGSFTIPASYLDTLDGDYTLKAIEILPEDAEENAEAAVLGATLTVVGMEVAEINGCGVDDELTINWTEGDLEITVSGMEISDIAINDTTLAEGDDYVIEDGIITISSDVLESLTEAVNTISFTGLDVLGNEVTISGNLVVGGDSSSSSSSSSSSDNSSSSSSGSSGTPSAPPSSSTSDSTDSSTSDGTDSSTSDGADGTTSGGTNDSTSGGTNDSTSGGNNGTGDIDPGFSQGGDNTTEGGTTTGGASDEVETGSGVGGDENDAGDASTGYGEDSSYGGYGSSAGDSSSSPQTGDTNTLGIWCAVILLCGAALIGTAVLLKKRENG